MLGVILYVALVGMVLMELFGNIRLATTELALQQVLNAIQALALFSLIQTFVVLLLFGVLVYALPKD